MCYIRQTRNYPQDSNPRSSRIWITWSELNTWICPQDSNPRPRAKMQARRRTLNFSKCNWCSLLWLQALHQNNTSRENRSRKCCMWNSCSWFWWKTDKKRCTNNYVMSRVKKLSSLVFCRKTHFTNIGHSAHISHKVTM